MHGGSALSSDDHSRPASTSLEHALEWMEAGKVETLIVAENDLARRVPAARLHAALAKVKNLIVLDCIATPMTARATVVLPAGAFTESDGTLVNNEGRAQRFFQTYVPEGGGIRESWRWLQQVAEAALGFGSPVAFRGPDTVWVDVSGTSHLFGGTRPLALLLAAHVRALGHSARIAVASGPWLARAFAQHADFDETGVFLADSSREAQQAGALPIAALPISSDAVAWFARLGLLSLDELRKLAPVQAVYGNVDDPADPGLSKTLNLKVDSVRIHVSHGHEFGSPTPAVLLKSYDADVVVYGHTHRPLVHRERSRLVVNPGAAGPRRFDIQPSVALMTVEGENVDVKIIALTDPRRR